MERNCDNCKHRDVYYMAPPCDECNFEYQRQPQKGFQNWESDAMTNADKIRSMTDEGLAEWIADDLIEPGYNTREQTVKMWLNWLREEAKG